MSVSGSRSGFSLLEVIVATAVMALAVVGALALTTQSLSNAAQVRQLDRAAMLARSQMGVLQTVLPAPINSKLQGQFDEQWSWEAVMTPLEGPPGGTVGRSLFVRIFLTINWNDNGRPRSVEFEGFRRVKITEAMGDVTVRGQLAPGRLF